MTDPLDFTGKVVLVTGGATGIGRATARAFAQRGASVTIGDVNEEAAETVRIIESEGGSAKFVRTDVTSAEDVRRLVQSAVDSYGGLHVAFNNAGILPPTGPLVEQSEEDFDKTVAVDLKGVFLALKYEIEHMAAHGGGSIINTASVAGVIADPGMSPYVAAKHGVVGLTKAAALDYGSVGVRVNALAPGLVETPMTEVWKADSEVWDSVAGSNFFRRAAQPEEIAGTVLFLASDLASFTTGAVFTADAGQTAR